MILKRLTKPKNDPMKLGVPMELYNIFNYLTLVRGFNLGRGDLFRPSDMPYDSTLEAA